MRFSILLSLLPLAISVGAINVTEPAKGDKLDVSDSFTVKWTSVNTDASTVDIVLINNNVYPNVQEKIASGVDTSKGSYTASGLKGVTNGSGFQINLLSTEAQNTGILAQSQKFDVTEPEKSSSSASTTGTSSTVSSESSSASTSGTTSSASTSTGAHTTETDASTTASGSTSTGTTTGTKTNSGMTTSATGSATGSASATATTAPNAGMALVAPAAAAGLIAGVLALL
ncbi:Cell wall beta-glucan synthesis [Penicillium cf. griseofulvum]|uniref:Cell wall beta-glucan synthesis n=1 Tax=Penicillium cf. griseofulvum TaxID=2972120 RepID=A0A9W9IVC1_9EURO|nr:Cell wall beta-glucan synthesis [Penicillium cf. griseofulvum]KAJ5429400.1 Cell wall beta-glucan synthesis [Penicillium cf. griseofulvum]KAJ5436818.1 Cell wall beta-glucan synthesis [Penicillium cf. griseofulvum]